MAITQAIANAFKKQLLEADMDFASASPDKFKLSLYTSSATLNSTSTAYTSTNERLQAGSIRAGGGAFSWYYNINKCWRCKSGFLVIFLLLVLR